MLKCVDFIKLFSDAVKLHAGILLELSNNPNKLLLLNIGCISFTEWGVNERA
jgi:hypothetical protein